MAQFNRLSDREVEVIKLILEGKSNKQIAALLYISVRTVEFHLKNIYAKFGVASRIELILCLGRATGAFDLTRLGRSTVAGTRESAENRDRRNSREGWAASLGDAVSMIKQELEMKNLLNSRHVLVGLGAALLAGMIWVAALLFFQGLPATEVNGWVVPLAVVWAVLGLTVGAVGKRIGSTLVKVFFSTLLGTGLGPFTIIPLMTTVVLPIGKLAQGFGWIDPSTMPGDVALLLGKIAIVGLWLIVGAAAGSLLLFVSVARPAGLISPPSNPARA